MSFTGLQRRSTKHLGVGLGTTLAIVVGSLFGAAPAQAISSSISATVNTTTCPTTAPVLANGGFEDFSNPTTTSNLQTGTFNITGWWGSSAYSYGWWHGYANGPDQILFLNSAATSGSNLQAGKSSNFVTGWKSTSPMIEIQRQVGDYAISHDDAFNSVAISPSRNGVGSLSTTGSSGYFDLYGPQPAEGSYWAELNAVEDSALYQDIQVPATAQLFWSLKHRGRSDSAEVMKVLIGDKPIGSPGVMSDSSLLEQTVLRKFAPTNSDKYAGFPTYSAASSSTSVISDKLSDGWTKYMGTVDPVVGANSSSPVRNVRFQFQSVTGANGGAYPTVGNLLDDISFTPFVTCPVTRTLYAGQTATVDVTGSDGGTGTRISYGVGQSLSAIGNLTGGANSGQYSSSGNSISFTPSAGGVYTADYQMEMSFGGSTYVSASRITYNVVASPLVTFDPNHDSTATSSATVVHGNQLSTITFPIPTRAGYTFDGWYTAATGGTIVDSTYAANTTMTSDQTYFAHWTAVPTPPAPASSQTTSDQATTLASLATTGSNETGVILIALGLLVAGGALYLLRRLRRNDASSESQHSRGIPGE